ncbi:pilus assembly protein TadE [Burkholderia ubonensis]|uniref:TadE/TadG family type IV pilus assembly protein n=1 Tax=Burkholderia ubonensis TaxID=101571 RepID=UPI0007544803|nr:TadE family protein [Burkholderia ubonensis]KVD39787.1 pilus assembly protein TadE [Burkholderia ubonensis]KVD55073.1 pilus assembly protein TadE [Burkholderia ubonensis]
MTTQRQPCARRRQRGATAVEFALVFPLFFVIFYALVSYGLIFAIQQNLTLAATEGARAALNYVPEANGQGAQALQDRASAARRAAQNLTRWLPNVVVPAPSSAACSYDASMYCVTVTVTYPYAQYPLVPSLPLLGFVLPSALTSTATVQINPATIL